MRLALAALALYAGTAIAEEAPEYTVDTSKWGLPKVVVPPTYPKAALEGGVTGHVDLVGVILPLGRFEVETYRAEPAAAEVFVGPLKEVIGHWELRPWLGVDCLPSKDKVLLRVWFEIAEGKPKISVGLPEGAKRPRTTYRTASSIKKPEYPHAMNRSGYQALVFARMIVQGDGEVTEVGATAFPQRPDEDRSAFVTVTREALRKWRFNADPGSKTKRVCSQVLYRLD